MNSWMELAAAKDQELQEAIAMVRNAFTDLDVIIMRVEIDETDADGEQGEEDDNG